MLLDEFLKEHGEVEEQDRKAQEQEARLANQEATIAQLKSTAAKQQEEIGALRATLKEQAAQIQKVFNRLEANKTPTQLIVSSQ